MRGLVLILALVAGGARAEPGTPTPSAEWMTEAEMAAFGSAVAACWVVPENDAETDIRVTVAFSLDREGRVEGEIVLREAWGGDEAAHERVFQSLRRAVLRCQGAGYDLPAERYESWREVLLTGDVAEMRP